MASPLIPKLSIPLTMGAHGLESVEQGSIDEITGCVYAIIATPLGSRVELPDFGVEDPTFEQLPLDLEIQFMAAVAEWEPRAVFAGGSQEVLESTANITLEISA